MPTKASILDAKTLVALKEESRAEERAQDEARSPLGRWVARVLTKYNKNCDFNRKFLIYGNSSGVAG